MSRGRERREHRAHRRGDPLRRRECGASDGTKPLFGLPPNTRRLLARRGRLPYDSDAYNDDLPQTLVTERASPHQCCLCRAEHQRMRS